MVPNILNNATQNLPGLQAFWFFSIAVAGKNATTTEKAINDFLWKSKESQELPYHTIVEMCRYNTLMYNLKRARTGMYGKLNVAFQQTVERNLHLQQAPIEELERIHGVGPKTSRFFLTYTREGCQNEYAILDTHILKWLRAQGYEDAPKATPSKSQYGKWEKIFLQEAKKLDMVAADLDTMIWESYRK